MRKVSQTDIARALNVSRVTVTKALKDHPDIAERTREQIKKMALEMGYIPDFIGRSLSSRRTFTIGLVLPKIAHSFFAHSVESFYEAAHDRGYNIIPMISFEDSEKELANIRTLLSMRVDGLIIDIAGNSTEYTNYDLAKRAGSKILFYDRCPVSCTDGAVVTDDRKAARDMVRILIDKGYRKIFHFAGPSALSIASERQKGYEDAMSEKGLLKYILNVELKKESGYEAFMKLNNEDVRPDAIFCVNDSVAHGIYQACRELKLKIPGDIAIAGFGDIETSRLLYPPLTTIRMPVGEMTKSAIDILVKMIEDNDPYIEKKVINSEIIIRESV